MISLLIISLLLTPDCGHDLKGHVERMQRIVDGNHNTMLKFRIITQPRKGIADTATARVRRNGYYKRTEIGKMIVAEDKQYVVFIMNAEKRILIRQQHPQLSETTNALKMLLTYLDNSNETTCERRPDGSVDYDVNLVAASKSPGPATRMNITVDANGSIAGATTQYAHSHPDKSMSVDNIELQATAADKAIEVPAISLVYEAGNRQRREFKNYTILDMRKKIK